jgi:hypothetical protein
MRIALVAVGDRVSFPLAPGQSGTDGRRTAQEPTMPGMIRRFPTTRKRIDRIGLAYGASMAAGMRQRELFGQVQTYCMFIGYPRSGHSLVGSLLDAHPDMVIAHELDALGFIQNGFHRNQLYALILNNSRQIAAKGRIQTGYDYQIPNQWQGRFRRLQVIGDKRGRGSMTRLQRRPGLLERMQRTVRDPMRFVHVVRNPFDNISTMSKRRDWTLEQAADIYFSLADTVAGVKRSMGDERVIDVRHEAVIADAKGSLKEICGFLSVVPTDDYLEDCAGIIYASPHRSRHEAPWTDALKSDVHARMERYPFLRGYGWDD